MERSVNSTPLSLISLPQVHIWDLNTQKILRTFYDEVNEVGKAILALDINPETNEIICNGGEHDILVYSLSSRPPPPTPSEEDRPFPMNGEEE